MNVKTPRPKLILHIGRHKTGTTSLQYCLHENRDLLREAGILYPETGVDWVAHHGIADRIHQSGGRSRFPSRDDLLSRLFDEIRASGLDAVLISSEGFQRCDPAVVRRVFRDFDVTVIVYLRDQLSYLQSSWLQAIHAENYHDTIEAYERDIFHCDYAQMLSAWAKAFLQENIVIRIYSKDFLVSGDVVRDFFASALGEITGIDFESGQAVSAYIAGNSSLRGDAIRFKRRLNAVIESDRYYFAELYKALGAYSGAAAGPVNLVSKELAGELESRYRASNSEVIHAWSLPSTALDFREVSAHVTPEMMGGQEFHAFLQALIRTDPACGILFRECYSYEVHKADKSWVLEFCRNILCDSLGLVKIKRNGQELNPETLGERSPEGFSIPFGNFDPVSDQVMIKYSDGATVALHRNEPAA